MEENEHLGEQPTFRYNFDTIEEYLSTAERMVTEGRADEGIDILREAAARHPESAVASYNLGVAIFLKLREDLSHMELWESLADDEEMAEECHAAFQSAIERDPMMAPAYSNLGTLLALRGRTRKAIESWEKSLELDANQPEIAQNLEFYRQQLDEDDVLRKHENPKEQPDKGA